MCVFLVPKCFLLSLTDHIYVCVCVVGWLVGVLLTINLFRLFNLQAKCLSVTLFENESLDLYSLHTVKWF